MQNTLLFVNPYKKGATINTLLLLFSLLANGYFETQSLSDEGFIHCARPGQLYYVMNKYFKADSYKIFVSHKDKLGDKLVYEGKDPSDLYPHLYRRFNKADNIYDFRIDRNEDGTFHLPRIFKN